MTLFNLLYSGLEIIQPAMPWEQVEKKFKTKVPARAKKIRRKLNVPSDRFRIHEDGQYVWAGENGDQLFCGELL